jgi:DeoR/GlpR family transcriptional regulator of sugar metabolism
VDELFVGVDGYTPDIGFTGRNHLRAAVVKHMVSRAEHVTVLTESLKFSRLGAVPLIATSGVTRVITDENLDATMQEHLEGAGVTVATVPAS